jgi:hypothetical protein
MVGAGPTVRGRLDTKVIVPYMPLLIEEVQNVSWFEVVRSVNFVLLITLEIESSMMNEEEVATGCDCIDECVRFGLLGRSQNCEVVSSDEIERSLFEVGVTN